MEGKRMERKMVKESRREREKPTGQKRETQEEMERKNPHRKGFGRKDINEIHYSYLSYQGDVVGSSTRCVLHFPHERFHSVKESLCQPCWCIPYYVRHSNQINTKNQFSLI